MGTGLQHLDTDWITGRITGAAIDVHGYLGPGMLEHTCEVCLEAALRQRGLQVERPVPVRVRYLDVDLECGYRIHMLAERQVVVELNDALAAGGWKRVLRRKETKLLSSEPSDTSDHSVSRC